MSNLRAKEWGGIVAALLAGFALRAWFIVHSPRIAGDTFVYGEIARNWVQHGVYGWTSTNGIPQPTLIRLPGFPLFLAACFGIFGQGSYTAVMDLQCVIDLLSCVGLGILAGRLFGPRARMAALWLSALCPFTANYVAAPLTETLTLACIVAVFYALERWQAKGLGYNRWLWMIVVALSYGLLLRPEQGLMAAAVVPAMLWMTLRLLSGRIRLTRAVIPVVAAAFCILLPLVPWTIRNWHTFHLLQPLAPKSATDPGEKLSPGFQRWYRTWAVDFSSTEDVYWNYDGAPIPIADLPTRAFDSKGQYAQTAVLLSDYNQDSNATPQLDARFERLAEDRIAASPLRYYVELPVARVLNMALRPRAEMLNISLEWWKWREHRRETEFATFYAALNLAYFVLAGWGFVRWLRRGRPYTVPMAAMLASVVLRSALLLTLDNSEPRYTLEFFPVLIIFASLVFAGSTAYSRSYGRSA